MSGLYNREPEVDPPAEPDASIRDLLAAAEQVQSVSSTGRPSVMRELGARLVDAHAEALRRLADA